MLIDVNLLARWQELDRKKKSYSGVDSSCFKIFTSHCNILPTDNGYFYNGPNSDCYTIVLIWVLDF